MIIVLDHVALSRVLRSPTGIVGRDARRRGQRVRDLARLLAPKRSGRLAASIGISVRVGPGGVTVRVGSDLDYATYVHEGTGVYGPRHRPITATGNGVMVFRGAGGELVYARTVSGTRGTPYLTRALRAAV